MVSGGERSEIAFLDIETTVPTRPGQGFGIIEFGAILVCPRKLVELQSYSTLIRPTDLSLISTLSVRPNGISKDAVLSSPTFAQIADTVYELLHGRIWAGHNIVRFDCARIREAFSEINRPPPEPKGTIDSLALLTQRFGRRAGDMKMATLATYFGIGQQTHRSLDDVRMNLEVLKYCATVLFLESSLPNIFTANSWVSPNAFTRSRNGKASPDGIVTNPNPSSSSAKIKHRQTSFRNKTIEGNHPILSLMTPNTGGMVHDHAESTTARPDPFGLCILSDEVDRESLESDKTIEVTPNTGDMVPDHAESSTAHPDPFDLGILSDEVDRESLELDETIEEESGSESPESSVAAGSESSSADAGFLEPDEVSIPSITVSLVPFYRGTKRIQILHQDITLQICCTHLKVRFGINRKFVDYAGRPRLNFVVDATPNLCQILDACDSLAQRLSVDSGSSSEWWPLVTRKGGFWNSPTIRLQIPTVADGSNSRWVTEIYEQDSSATPQRLVFSRFDVEELLALFIPGTLVDAYLSLDPYDYQQNAGIRLVAKKLIVHSTDR